MSSREINAEPASRVRYGVMALLAAAAAIAYLCRNGMVLAEKSIRTDLGLTEDQMGFLLGPAFFWPYALMQLPLSALGIRFGVRVWLPFLMLVTALSTGLFGLGGAFLFLMLCRAISGTAQAGLFPGCTQTISRWFPATERGLASGVLGASMSVGGALGMALTGQLLGHFGWSTLSYLYALPGIVWAGLFWLGVRNDPADHPRVNASELAHIRGPVSPDTAPVVESTSRLWLVLIMSPALWLICMQQFFRASAYAFFQSWFPKYLQDTRGVSTEASGHLTALPLLATVAGMLCGGSISDWVFRRTGSLILARKVVAITAVTASGVIVLLAALVADPLTAVLVISVGAFLAGMAGPIAYTITIDLGGKNVAPIFATMNMLGNVGAGLLPWIVPWIRRTFESDPDLLSLAGGTGWNAVLGLFAAMYFGAGLAWLALRVRSSVVEQSYFPR